MLLRHKCCAELRLEVVAEPIRYLRTERNAFSSFVRVLVDIYICETSFCLGLRSSDTIAGGLCKTRQALVLRDDIQAYQKHVILVLPVIDVGMRVQGIWVSQWTLSGCRTSRSDSCTHYIPTSVCTLLYIGVHKLS